jgi:endonuclease YncB( thermonuclease family)
MAGSLRSPSAAGIPEELRAVASHIIDIRSGHPILAAMKSFPGRIAALFFVNRFILAVGVCGLSVTSAAGGARAWKAHGPAKFSEKREADGDSFGIEIKGAKGKAKGTVTTYRLYGVDCPETDARGGLLKARIAAQAKDFHRKAADIPLLGKNAAAFTQKTLKGKKLIIWTYGAEGEVAPKGPKGNDRFYALVEVITGDGKHLWLHELLLENGHARVEGDNAPWPPKDLARLGKDKARKRFESGLKPLAHKAEAAHLGAWGP